MYDRPICSLYHWKQEPKKSKFYDNKITFRRGQKRPLPIKQLEQIQAYFA